MKIEKRCYVILALLVAFSSVAVLAQGPGKRGRAGQGGPLFQLTAFLRGLDLSDAQKEQVKNIVATYKPEFRTPAREQATARKALQEVIRANPNHQELWREAFRTVTESEWNLLLLREKVRGEIFKVLTPEQMGKIEARRTEAGKRGW